MIGPNDLAADLGMPGQVESKEILKAAELAAEEAARAGKSSGIITSKKDADSFLQRTGNEFIQL